MNLKIWITLTVIIQVLLLEVTAGIFPFFRKKVSVNKKRSFTPLELEEIQRHNLKDNDIYFFNEGIPKHERKKAESKMAYKELKHGMHILFRYEVLELIGEGRYGRVYRAFDHKQNPPKEVALKVEEKSDKKYFKNYLKLLPKLQQIAKDKNVHLLAPLDYFSYSILHVSVFELMEMDLKNLSSEKNRKNPPELWSLEELNKLLKQMLTVLKALKENGIVHADIKLENILVDKNGDYYLTDFGVAHFDDSNKFLRDMWGLESSINKLIHNTPNNHILNDLLKDLLTKMDRNNITPEQALEHEFIVHPYFQ